MKPDPVRAPASREPERDNASLQPARTSVRAPMRPRAAVFQRLAGSEPGRPFRGRRGRALEPLRGSTDRPSFLNDQSRETESSERGQWGVSVSHEDLLAEMVCGNPHPPGGLPFSAQPFTTCRGTTASRSASLAFEQICAKWFVLPHIAGRTNHLAQKKGRTVDDTARDGMKGWRGGV